MLVRRLRRWLNNNPTLVQCIVLTDHGISHAVSLDGQAISLWDWPDLTCLLSIPLANGAMCDRLWSLQVWTRNDDRPLDQCWCEWLCQGWMDMRMDGYQGWINRRWIDICRPIHAFKWMNESLKGWMNEFINGRSNVRTNKRANERTNERTNEQTSERTNERTNYRTN